MVHYNPDEEIDKMVTRLRSICEIQGISISAAAKKADISSSTMSELLSGKSRPQLYTLYRICNSLDVSLAEILGIESNSGELTGEERQLLDTFRHMPEWKQEKIRDYIQMTIQYRPES